MLNKELQVALVFSFLWHAFLFSAVSLVFLPESLPLNQHPAVAFLGSILRDPLVRGPRAERGSLLEMPLGLDTAKSSFLGRPVATPQVDKEALSPDDFVGDVDRQKEQVAQSFRQAPGEYSGREVIFQPSFQIYPEWQQRQPEAGSVVLRILVSPEGLVEEVVNVRSSGDPDIDAALARYVRRWHFAPLVEQKVQWQTVTIRLDLERATPILLEMKEG